MGIVEVVRLEDAWEGKWMGVHVGHDLANVPLIWS